MFLPILQTLMDLVSVYFIFNILFHIINNQIVSKVKFSKIDKFRINFILELVNLDRKR